MGPERLAELLVEVNRMRGVMNLQPLEEIQKGEPHMVRACPLANSLERVEVEGRYIVCRRKKDAENIAALYRGAKAEERYGEELGYEIRLPGRVGELFKDFVEAFDDGHKTLVARFKEVEG